jgi:hypothetical protein
VCQAHGGSLTRTRRAARERLTELAYRRAFDRSWARYRRARVDWHIRRLLTVSSLLGVDPVEVDMVHILECRWTYGVPAPIEEEPQPRDFPLDRRITRSVEGLYREGKAQ